jgi:hypothetical protein
MTQTAQRQPHSAHSGSAEDRFDAEVTWPYETERSRPRTSFDVGPEDMYSECDSKLVLTSTLLRA